MMSSGRRLIFQVVLSVCCCIFVANAVYASEPNNPGTIFTIDEYRSRQLVNKEYSGLKPGEYFPLGVVTDLSGKQIDLRSIQQKMLVFYSYRCLEQDSIYTYLNNLAEHAAGKMLVMCVFLVEPSQELANRLKQDGIIVVPNYKNSVEDLRLGHSEALLLVDEKKEIQYKVMLKKELWQDVREAVGYFVDQGKVPDRYHRKLLTANDKLCDLQNLKDIHGKPFLTQNLGNKPTLLVYLPTPEVLPLLHKVSDQYKDKINIIIVRPFYRLETIRILIEYYQYVDKPFAASVYGEEVVGQSVGIDYLKNAGFTHYTCLMDEDRRLGKLLNIEFSNSLIILDENNSLVAGFIVANATYRTRAAAMDNAVIPEDEIGQIINTLLAK